MLIKVIKRDGRIQDFSFGKIEDSISQAALRVREAITIDGYEKINQEVYSKLAGVDELTVERLQDIIETSLYNSGFRKVRESYKTYRNERSDIRESKLKIRDVINAIGVETDRDNGNR